MTGKELRKTTKLQNASVNKDTLVPANTEPFDRFETLQFVFNLIMKMDDADKNYLYVLLDEILFTDDSAKHTRQ